MAESDTGEIGVVAKASKSSSSFLNRSLTLNWKSLDPSQKLHHHPTSLARTDSVKKFYNPLESVWSATTSIKGKVKKLRDRFESPKNPSPGTSESQAQLLSKLKSTKTFVSAPSFRLPGSEDRIVMYFTSLRGVRRTYEDCYAVRMIFRGFRVWIDERDVSMDSAYRKELQSVLVEKNVSLPQVFVRGKYLGGADVIKQLFEVGELAKILEGFPVRKPGFVCESCGDVRFLPCANCSGSRKLFDEDEGVLKRCLECNENGLIRCPDCGH